MRDIVFHFGAACHPVSWILHAVYGSSYGIALASARTWHDRMLSSPGMTDTPPGGQFVLELKNGKVARSELLFDAEYFRERQEPQDLTWLCQFQAFPLDILEPVKRTVTEALRTRLIDVGFLIPRVEWETRYPDQAEILRQFRAMSRPAGDDGSI